nr:MAG TPA: YvrJ protein family protein [Caudoviricetes sp.]
MKFFSASIAAILDIIQQSNIMKLIPGAQRQPPEGAGKRQPAQEPGILFYSLFYWRCTKKMDANTVLQAVSNVGFPIAAFLLMWYQCNTVVKENTAAITEMRVALDDIKKG